MIKISDELSKNLTEASKSSVFQKNYDKIFKVCFTSIAEEQPSLKNIESLKALSDDQSEIKFVFNVFFLLTVESIENHLLATEARTLLEEFISNKEIIDNYIEKYTQFNSFANSKDSDIQETKLNSSIPFNKVVDVEWKMLHSVASKHLMRITKDIYLITLKYVTPEGTLQSYTFKCSYEELTELVDSLNTACNAISKACDQNELISKNA